MSLSAEWDWLRLASLKTMAALWRMAGLSKPQICEEYLRKQSLRMVLAPKRYPFLAARLSRHTAHVTTNLQVKREQQSVLDNGAHTWQGKLIRERARPFGNTVIADHQGQVDYDEGMALRHCRARLAKLQVASVRVACHRLCDDCGIVGRQSLVRACQAARAKEQRAFSHDKWVGAKCGSKQARWFFACIAAAMASFVMMGSDKA